jgi:hypothetical protein
MRHTQITHPWFDEYYAVKAADKEDWPEYGSEAVFFKLKDGREFEGEINKEGIFDAKDQIFQNKEVESFHATTGDM